MTEYVEIICPTKDATFLTYTVLRTDKHEQISVIVLLDDGIGIDPDEQLCQHIVNEVKIDLIKSGFVPKAEKSFWHRKVIQEICKIYVLHLLTRKTPNIQYGDKKCQHDDMLSEYRT
jgi:hypothetical protein